MKISQVNASRPWWAIECNLEARVVGSTLRVGHILVSSHDGIVEANLEDGDSSSARFVAAVDDSDLDKITGIWSAVESFCLGMLQDRGMTVWHTEDKKCYVFVSRDEWNKSR